MISMLQILQYFQILRSDVEFYTKVGNLQMLQNLQI